MSSILDFFLALHEGYMLRGIIVAVIIGVVGGVIGVFVLLRGMVFLGEAIAHSAFAGAALGILIAVDPLITVIIFGVIAAVGVGYVNEKKVMKDEVIIGVVFTFFMALAILFIGLMKTYSTNVTSILFGDILTVSKENFIILVFLSIAVLMIIFALKKELYMVTFNVEMAEIAGIPVRTLNYIFLVAVALTIDVSLKAIGAILVFAMIVTPAAAAYQWTFKLNKMMLLSSLFGTLSAIFGLFFSFLFNLPSGSTIVAIATLIFVVSFVMSPKRRKAGQTVEECGFCSKTIAGETYCLDEACLLTNIAHKHDEKGVVILAKDLNISKIELKKHKHDKGAEK